MNPRAALQTRLYACTVFHLRKTPVEHRFTYRYFTFCLDLDEIEVLAKRSIFFGLGRLKAFRFVPEDFIFGKPGDSPSALKAAVAQFANKMGFKSLPARIEILAHVRTFGYSYNPAAFYFGYDQEDRLLFGIVEVTNTFREKKAYFVPGVDLEGKCIRGEEQKLFYVSPFVDLNTCFEFTLGRPEERFHIQIDSKSTSGPSPVVVHASLVGERRPIKDSLLFFYLLKFPFVPLAVMARIHVQAAFLYFKRISYFKKSDRPELQKRGLP